MIVLDANVLIAYLDDEPVHHGRAANLLRREIDDSCGANPLTLAQGLVLPARTHQLDAVQKVLEDLGIRPLEFPADAAAALAELCAETGLRVPDCCVLLAAEHSEAAWHRSTSSSLEKHRPSPRNPDRLTDVWRGRTREDFATVTTT